MRKILFKHGRAPGDCLMLSAGVRDFKALFPHIGINVKTQFPDIFENNPHLDRGIDANMPGVEIYDVGYPQIQGCNSGNIHFSQCFLQDMICQTDAHEPLPMSVGEFCASYSGGGDKSLGEGEHARSPFREWRKKYSGFTTTVHRQYGDIHLTEAERGRDVVRDLYGCDQYWIIAAGGKRDCTCKIWDWRRMQDVVDHFAGHITFVAVGRSDHLIEGLRNVISFVDKTPRLRDLFPLFYHASGVVSGVSFPLHLAAAMPPNPRLGGEKSRKPAVAIYGGREPTSFTWYCNHQILHTNGGMSCCDNGGCWQSRVTPIAKDADNKRLAEEVERLNHFLMVSTPLSEETAGKHYVACIDKLRAENTSLQLQMDQMREDLSIAHEAIVITGSVSRASADSDRALIDKAILMSEKALSTTPTCFLACDSRFATILLFFERTAGSRSFRIETSRSASFNS